MADAIKKAKAVRISKLGSFTRKKNHLQQLLDGGAVSTKLKEVYAELSEAFKALEQAQEDLLVELPEESLEAELTYLDAPANVLSSMDVKVGTSVETEKQEQLREKNAEDEAVKRQESLAAQAAFKSKLEGFGKPSVNLTELSTEKNISFLDMRAEVKKLEDMQAKLLEEKV